MKPVYVIDSVRTPVGKYGGALSSVRPDDLLAYVIKSLLHRNGTIDVNAIEDVIAGDANQAGEDNRNVARMAALLAGLPVTVAGNTVNRLCASGLQAIMDAARQVNNDDAALIIAAGVESMTRAPPFSAMLKYMIPRLAGVLPIRNLQTIITLTAWVKRPRMWPVNGKYPGKNRMYLPWLPSKNISMH
jgi:acetyl-CoA acetyltransferase